MLHCFQKIVMHQHSRAGLDCLQEFLCQLVNLLCLLGTLKALPELLTVCHIPVSEAGPAAVVAQRVADAVCIREAAARRRPFPKWPSCSNKMPWTDVPLPHMRVSSVGMLQAAGCQ